MMIQTAKLHRAQKLYELARAAYGNTMLEMSGVRGWAINAGEGGDNFRIVGTEASNIGIAQYLSIDEVRSLCDTVESIRARGRDVADAIRHWVDLHEEFTLEDTTEEHWTEEQLAE